MTDHLLDHLQRALGEAYGIERELTGAGMSRVFVARERALGREVVIKVLPKELALGVNRERFQQEIRLAARLSHPYIVPLLHAGEHEDLLWFTMPFISGESLKARIEASGAQPIRDVVQIARDVAEALAYAHAQGVVHRDIKPANILLEGNHGLVTDFGVAKALNAAMPSMGSGHTTTGMAIGTPAYMAPEQLAADPSADHRIDLYALGLVMYEALAGRSPFSAPSPAATMAAQLTQIPDPLTKVRPDVPAPLAKLIGDCLAKTPEERPATAAEVVEALDRVAEDMAAGAYEGGHRRGRRLMVAAIALSVTAVAAAGLWIRWSDTGATPVTLPPPPAASSTLDQPQVVPIAPGDLAPQTYEDTLKMRRAYIEALLALGDSTFAESRRPTSGGFDPEELRQLQSMVNAMMEQQFRQSRAQVSPPETLRTVVVTPSTIALRPMGDMLNQDSIPTRRRLVVETMSFGRGGDSALRQLSEQISRIVSDRPARGWEVIQRPGRFPGMRGGPDTTLATAAMIVRVSLDRGRTARDSVTLRIEMTRLGDGETHLVVSNPVWQPTSPSDFEAEIDQSRSLIWWLQLAPPGTNNPPPGMGDGRGGRGGPPGGRRGGPARGGQPPWFDSLPD